MGSQELLEKVRADGRARVAAIEQDRDQELAGIEKRREEEVGRLEQEHRANTERETRLIFERARSRARLEQRNRLLAAQWQQIDTVVKQAAARMVEDKGYVRLVGALVKRHADKDSVVRFSKADSGRLKAGAKAKTGSPAGISGGVLIEQGRVTLDFSIDRALEAIRGRLAPDLAKVLFPDESARSD